MDKYPILFTANIVKWQDGDKYSPVPRCLALGVLEILRVEKNGH